MFVGESTLPGSTASPSVRGSSPGIPTQPIVKPKKLRRLVVLLVVLGVVAGLAVVGMRTWPWPFYHRDESVNELTLYGNVDIRQVQLAFNGNDRIASMQVKEGDRVERGQLLATLDTRRLKATVARMQAQVESQRQIVARLVAGTRIEDIRKARADVQLAQADVKNAKRTFERRKSLASLNAASQQEADDAEAAAEVAEARRNANKALLDLAVAGPRKEDIAEAKATLTNYEAQLALAQDELADALLYAPSKGVIQERILEPGDMASPQKSVFTLALSDPVWVRAYVSEPDLGKITLGMTADVESDSFQGKRYSGWIGFISPTAEFTPKSVEVRQLRTRLVYQVRVFVDNPRDELRLGMPVTVHVPLDQSRPQDGAEKTNHP